MSVGCRPVAMGRVGSGQLKVTHVHELTTQWSSSVNSRFLPARRYASAGYRDRNVSVCPSVRPSVRHAPVLCQNEES